MQPGGSDASRGWIRVLRIALGVGVVGLLIHQLAGIGWREVWESRPRTPWFYVIWAVLYSQLMLVELGIYGRLWQVSLRDLWPVLLRKRVLNTDVVSYSGEAYFFLWAQRRVPHPTGQILGTIKDNAIASMLGSWGAALILLGVFLYTGQIALVDVFGPTTPLYVAGGLLLLAIGSALLARFRKTIFTLPPRTVLTLIAVHAGRFLVIIYVLQIVQWWVVLPEAPLEVWATMLVILTVANRLPLVPAKDVLGAGAVLGVSSLLDASEPVIAAMLMTQLALNKSTHLILFAGTSLLDRMRRGKIPTGADEPCGRCP